MNIAKLYLLNGILNYYKCIKNRDRNYSPIIQGCMNTLRGKAKFKNVRI